MSTGRSCLRFCHRQISFRSSSFSASASSSSHGNGTKVQEEKAVGIEDAAPVTRPISHILKDLNKRVPDSLIKIRTDPSGFSLKYVPWHITNKILNLLAPEWSGEVRSVTYSPDGKSVTVVYRVTLYGTDAEIFRESTGTASIKEARYGDAVQTAEAMAFRRACARFGLGLHLYHDETDS